MQIIGIYLYGKKENRVVKNLMEDWYPFGNFDDCHGIFDDNGKISNINKYERIKKQLEDNQNFINELYKLENKKSPTINLNCILGKNGSGKSCLLNLEYRIINNFACKINYCLKDFNQGHSLIWATGFNAELYYFLNGEIYCIRIKNNQKFEINEQKESIKGKNPIEKVELLYKNNDEIKKVFAFLEEHYEDDSKEYRENEKNLIKLLSKHFFYSISTNYSIYSNATVYDFISGIEEQWQYLIYHKNDGYLTPIVLVPYKNLGSTINTENELKLAKERVATLSILIYLETDNAFIENLFPTKIRYSLKPSKNYIYEIKRKYIKLLNPDSIDSDTVVNLYKKINDIYHIYSLHRCVRKIWFKKLSENNFSCDGFKLSEEKIKKTVFQNTLEYLTYKLIKMCRYYDIYRNNFFEKDIINNYRKSPDKCKHIIESIIDKILKNQYVVNFTNLKIYQCLTFFKNIDFYVKDKKYDNLLKYENVIEINEFKEYIKKRPKCELSYDYIFMNLLPHYFTKETYFAKKEIKSEVENKELTLSVLSSGESQLLFSLSYAVYHMKNASSKQEKSERIAYNKINLVFDEAELYYHPEYQRKFIADLLKLISRSNLKDIDSINITIVTHSPFMLSDIPNSNIIALESGKRKKDLYFKTLGTNIYDLLKNNFFMTSTIGSQTEKNISNFISYYSKFKSEKNFQRDKVKEVFYGNLIDSVGDEYLNSKLKDMLLQIKKISFKDRKIQEYEEKIKMYEENIKKINKDLGNIRNAEN